MTHPIYFVSLGPGDPELITLKGLKILQKADIIYCPGTRTGRGETTSRAAGIVEDLGIESPVSVFTLPMSKNRIPALKVYDELYQQIFKDHQLGKHVAIVAEGDAGFYSSIQYLSDKLVTAGAHIQRIAGVPAFIAAGSLANLHIVKQEEQLHILPGITTEDELATLIEKGYTVVIMKLSQCKATVLNCLQRYPQTQWHYFENIGLANEFYSSDKDVIEKTESPYFSLMIILFNKEH